jgi:hypothetical protein
MTRSALIVYTASDATLPIIVARDPAGSFVPASAETTARVVASVSALWDQNRR